MSLEFRVYGWKGWWERWQRPDHERLRVPGAGVWASPLKYWAPPKAPGEGGGAIGLHVSAHAGDRGEGLNLGVAEQRQ